MKLAVGRSGREKWGLQIFLFMSTETWTWCIRFLVTWAAGVAGAPMFAQVAAAKADLKKEIRKPLTVSISPIKEDHLAIRGGDKATLAYRTAKANEAWSAFLRDLTTPAKGSKTARDISDRVYWNLLADPNTDAGVLMAIERRTNRAGHLASEFKKALSVIALEKDSAERATWTQRCAAMADALSAIDRDVERATAERFTVRQLLPYFAN